jgi:hypothetical protein
MNGRRGNCRVAHFCDLGIFGGLGFFGGLGRRERRFARPFELAVPDTPRFKSRKLADKTKVKE